ncbi:AsmA family protein [Snodgrassella sp. CFCC 13594]|uniref:AsmA family protein n=1 Tax=Snodgrassella sp. CFCC 13594 TaxID=1775559 RepID=UPI00082D80DF|nr:AsmA family protein [Snodgrassella sp. CFCC 13594]
MISLLHSGKFWLKTLVYGSIAMLLLLVASAATLHYVFNPIKLDQHLNGIIAQTGRQIRFDHNIDRGWFPRPTVTLSQVDISNPTRTGTDLHAGSLKIGLGWSSLLGTTHIEKLQWQDVTAQVRINAQGNTNFADLLQLWREPTQPTQINRVLINNGDFNVIDSAGQRQEWRQLQGKIIDLNDVNSPFELSGIWQKQGWPAIDWQISGNRHQDKQWVWQNLAVVAEGQLPYLGHTRAKWGFDGTWQPETHRLRTGDVQWEWQSERAALHASGTGKDWQLNGADFIIPQLNAVITGQEQNHALNATINLNQLRWQQQRWQIGQFQIESSWQNGIRQAALSLSGRLLWPNNQQWVLDDLTFSSHQDTVNRLPNPRWLSELSGRISGQGLNKAHMQWQGTLDNQPVHLAADFQQQPDGQRTLSGNLSLDQFNLGPYLQNAQPLQINPQWLQRWQQYLHNWHWQWQLQIGRIITPMMQLSDITTQIQLDEHSLVANPLRASLYEGHSDGMLRIDNTQPLQWQIQQNFSQVQIKPLLQDSLGFHNLDGQGNAQFNLRSQGLNSRDWLAHLAGTTQLNLQQGSMRGIDINNILQNNALTQTTLAYNELSQTPFQSLQLIMPLEQGLSRKSTISVHAKNFDISGLGLVNLGQKSMNYDVLINTRQPGSRNRLPLKMNGSLMRPSFSVDYQRLTAGLQTPQQKQQTLSQTLKKQWQWMNQGGASAPKTWPPKP